MFLVGKHYREMGSFKIVFSGFEYRDEICLTKYRLFKGNWWLMTSQSLVSMYLCPFSHFLTKDDISPEMLRIYSSFTEN